PRETGDARPVSAARRIAEWILLGFAACSLALALVGTRAEEVFAGSTRATATASGISTLGPVAVNAPNDRLGTAALDLAPGDAAERVVDVTNTGRRALQAVTLRTVASPSSHLDTDRVNGLQLVVDRCSVPWTESGGPDAHNYLRVTLRLAGSVPSLEGQFSTIHYTFRAVSRSPVPRDRRTACRTCRY